MGVKANTKSILLLVLAWAAGTRADIGLETVSDVRVGPLLATRWNQAFDTGYSNVGEPCYNYYLEGNKSGCSATALAQILRYWEFPADVVAQTFPCLVGNEETPLETRGGAFAWDLMPDVPAGGATEASREAVGHLVYDCAVALRSWFSPVSTFAFASFAFEPLRDYFGYACAVGYLGTDGEALSTDAIRPSILASLDGGSPVLLTILSDTGARHAVVVDGYGYEGGKEYFHLNFGLATRANAAVAWYPLLDAHYVNESGKETHYTQVDGLVYNIFPTGSGDVLSGRVLQADGTPATNVTVTAARGKNVEQTVTTDANGLYAFRLPGGVAYDVSVGRERRTVSLTKAVSAEGIDFREGLVWRGGTLGNSWGNDFTLTDDEPSPEDPMPDEPGPTAALGAFAPTKALNGVYPFCGVVRQADGLPVGTLSLKVGKASKKGVSKVSGSLVGLDGKKYAVASTSFEVNEEGPSARDGIVIKKFGVMSLALGENGFEATIRTTDGLSLTAVSERLSGGISSEGATFRVMGLPSEISGLALISGCSPDGERIAVDKRGKWVLGKAASVKYKKTTVRDPETGKKVSSYQLVGLDDPKRPNRSALKLSYAAKTGLFKGSFTAYCNAGTEAKPKLKKFTFTVTGLAVGGAGTGVAVCKKPALTCAVTID